MTQDEYAKILNVYGKFVQNIQQELMQQQFTEAREDIALLKEWAFIHLPNPQNKGETDSNNPQNDGKEETKETTIQENESEEIKNEQV